MGKLSFMKQSHTAVQSNVSKYFLSKTTQHDNMPNANSPYQISAHWYKKNPW